MSKTQKELAFLRDLYIANDWTLRFAELFDKKFKFSDEKKILYVNAGTGNHALELREKLPPDAELNAFSDDEELNIIAQAKADALHTKVDFSGEFPNEKFDAVICDIMMPGVNGVAALAQLKKAQPGLKVIMATAYATTALAAASMKGGATGYIAKPYDLKELFAMLDTALTGP